MKIFHLYTSFLVSANGQTGRSQRLCLILVWFPAKVAELGLLPVVTSCVWRSRQTSAVVLLAPLQTILKVAIGAGAAN